MAKKSHNPIPPTIDEVMAYLNTKSGPVTKRDLNKVFGLRGDNRANIKRMIRDMREKGLIRTERRGKTIILADMLPDRIVVEVTGLDSMGDLIARPFEWLSDTPAPQVIITKDRLTPPASIGDLIQVEVTPQGNRTYHARTLRRVTAGDNHLICVYQDGKVYSVDKHLNRSFVLTGVPHTNTLKNGDLVSVDIPPVRVKNPQALFVRQIGTVSDPYAPTLIAMYMHHLPSVFSEQVQKEAAKARSPRVGKNRIDLQNVPFVTIDGEDARDFDDAVWAEPDTAANNPGGYHIMIGIADVSWYVRFGTALDNEARLRGNSVYFPDRVLPMLPEALSNHLCSLQPNQPRAALVCEVWINKEGHKLRHTFHRAMIRSARRLTYTEVQAAMDGKTPIGGLESEINHLIGAYRALKQNRDKRCVLELDVPERQVVLNEKAGVKEIKLRQQLPSMQLIEELMILANVSAAETLEKTGVPAMYRIHARPSEEKMEVFKLILASMGQKNTLPDDAKPADFNALLTTVDPSLSQTLNEVILRTQSQAAYSPDNIGHFGLSLERYAHFTSPIRRYADILVHRALVKALKLGDDGLSAAEINNLTDIAHHISATERQAATAELDATDRYIARYLANKVGHTFAGRIVSITPFGVFLAVEPYGVEGFVPMRHLPGDYYEYEEDAQRLIGRVNGGIYTLGDQVRAVLKDAAEITGCLTFQIIQGDPRHQQTHTQPPKVVYKKHRDQF